MTLASKGKAHIIRTDRGLAIAGTRITLYDVMDYEIAQSSLTKTRSPNHQKVKRDRSITHLIQNAIA